MHQLPVGEDLVKSSTAFLAQQCPDAHIRSALVTVLCHIMTRKFTNAVLICCLRHCRIRLPHVIALAACSLGLLYWFLPAAVHVLHGTPSLLQLKDRGLPHLEDRLHRPAHASHLLDWSTRRKGKSAQKCQHPALNPFDPSVMQFYIKHPPVSCTAATPDWVYVTNGTFHISPQATLWHGRLTCEYSAILRDGDFAVRYGPPVKPMQDGQPIQTDFFKVSCVSVDGAQYSNIHSAVAWNPAVHARLRSYAANRSETGAESRAQQSGQRRPAPLHAPPSALPRALPSAPPHAPPSAEGLPLSVFMFGFDSLSRMAWQRYLPRTRRYLLQELGGLELQGYNIVGDGTPSALLPILTGKMEEELPEARRGFAGAKPVDNYPWIWKEFSRRGYVTAWAEDGQYVGTLQYRMLGFEQPPTDHYTRPFFLATEKNYNRHLPLCSGATPRHVRFMNWFRDLFDMYDRYPKFFFGFHSEMSHNDNNKVQALDDDLLAFLQGLETEGHLNSTLLILMADHGARFGFIRATAHGRLEERMPYFSFRFPPWFHRQYPDIVRNMEVNAKRLTTPFDIHPTLLDILHYRGPAKADISRRAVSLFSQIPKERACSDAEVTPYWCACLEWQPVNQSDALVVSAVREAVARINQFTQPQRSKCAELTLSQITGSSLYVCTRNDTEAQQKIDKYWNQYEKPSDGRYDGTTCGAGTEIYRVSFITVPGEGHFEVLCYRDAVSGSFRVSDKEISRINKYGSQPACITASLPHLRPYCYCT